MVTKAIRVASLLACFRLCEDVYVLELAQCTTDQCRISAAVMQDMCHENCGQDDASDIRRMLRELRDED